MSGRHEQEAWSSTTLHSALGPQGDGWHGFRGTSSWGGGSMIGWHLMNGSPVNLGGHEQIGEWFTTVHLAPIPQVPGQGSLHFWLLQASFWGQSALITHSGRHDGGLPIYPGIQEHTACPLISRHCAFGPHGDGRHGSVGVGSWYGLHSINAFPVIPVGHEHTGTWFKVEQIAFWPQVPGQGSTHLFLTQALSLGQSWFSTHSGRQPIYGSPWYSGIQVQIPLLHCAFGPHGDGLQGSWGIGSAGGGGFGTQLVKGSPVKPSEQVHIGTWLRTVQRALNPQEPGHGSRHFSLIHARLLGHSELITHSGRQFGGDPT